MKAFILKSLAIPLVALVFFSQAHAAKYTVKSLTLTGTEVFTGSYITVFAVNALGVFGTPTIDTVYFKVGPSQISSDSIVIPEMVFEVEGVKKPTHLVIIIHKQKAHSLNKLNSALLNGFPVQFEEPDYYNTSFRVPPTETNIRTQHKIIVPIKSRPPVKLQNHFFH